jgi:hypothetical protein
MRGVLPCPDCKSTRLAFVWSGTPLLVGIGCATCGLIDGDAETRAEAARKWNKLFRPDEVGNELP